jgi:23S rRNA pseudouridine2605 synthase
MAQIIRLNKFLAAQASVGRRQADIYIAAGRVRVNGRVAQLGAQVDPSHDTIEFNGKTVAASPLQQCMYIALNKPVGYVCSRRQQGDSPTIYTLLPQRYHHLKPVGRLDKDSSGILLLTNDGDMAHRLTHPSFRKLKRYEVTLDKPLQPLHRQMISDYGINLTDGVSKLQLERQHDNDDWRWLVSMQEGRNRQIRRTFAALGYVVTKLHRIQFGPLLLSDLGSKRYTEIAKPSY